MDIDTRLHPRRKLSHRATSFSQTASNLEFEVVGPLMDERPDPSQNVTRGQAHDDAVRVMDNHGIVDSKAQRQGGRTTSFNRALDFCRFHRVLLAPPPDSRT
jgi:hypothetical protein